MLCIHPYRPTDNVEYPCGKCRACAVNRRRMWTARIVLEATTHPYNAFVTLTIADVPRGHHGPPCREAYELNPALLRAFIRKLRARGFKVRYFACGEYGEANGRPHYHVALFGMPAESVGEFERAWGYGAVHVGSLTKQSAQYIAGYVCKKIGSTSDSGIRFPEFSRMSKHPALGATAISAIAAQFNASSAREGAEDVFAAVRISGSILPIGQYARRLARVACGMDPNMSQEARLRVAAEYAVQDKGLRERKRENTYISLTERLKRERLRRVL